MFGFLQNIVLRKKKSYEAQRESLKSVDFKARLKLAKSRSTSKEMLYYMAEKDPDSKVRRAVARNEALPVQASLFLARDIDQDVRLALAGRLVALLPDLSQDRHSQLYAYAVQAMGTLALDEVLKIRIALANTLKDHALTPPKVAVQLARDVERQVSEPVLRFCAALSDADLLDILEGHPESWVVEAIARRKEVSAALSEAVIRTQDPPGGRALIENEGAHLSEGLLHTIVEMARRLPEWQAPIAVRKSLPASIARELAVFVDASVRDLLLQRKDFDEHTTEEISAAFRRRVDFAGADDGAGTAQAETPHARLTRLVKAGALDEQVVSDALAMRDHEFVLLALASFLKTDSESIKRVFALRAAKPIIAMTWRAGLSMRLALQLQKEIGRVEMKALIYPKGGTDYPLSSDEMRWQLEFLGFPV